MVETTVRPEFDDFERGRGAVAQHRLKLAPSPGAGVVVRRHGQRLLHPRLERALPQAGLDLHGEPGGKAAEIRGQPVRGFARPGRRQLFL
jgi:hypothetical protein